MNEQRTFVLADHAVSDVVAQIQDDQWGIKVPDWFMHRFEHTPDVREIINYLAYDDAWVPDMLEGETMAEAGEDKFKGDLLGEDPKGNFGNIVEKASAAATAATELERTMHLSFGEYSMQHYFWQITQFRLFRAWDVARIVGATPHFSDDLIQGVWAELEPVAEEWRGYGIFGPAVEVPADASLLDRMLGLSGRDPSGF